MTMKEDKTLTKRSSSKENEPVFENGKKKSKEEKPSTKVVVRRLPPTMTEEQFKMQVAPLPDFDYFYFVSADMSLSPNAFCRAYINFIDQSDLFIFTQKFDGYVFIDSKGGEFPAVVEFAPFQRIPKIRPNRKKDPKVGTIEAEPVFIAFKEQLEAENLEKKATANAAKQHFFETSLVAEKKEMNTPLLDYIKNRRAERQRVRDEKREEKRKKDLERRRAKEEQRRIKKEEDTSVVKVLNSPSANKERIKEKEVKPTFVKKKSDEAKLILKEKSSTDSRSKESKPRTGKSYLEERQRQAERREEQKKKLILNQSATGTEIQSATPEDKSNAIEDKEPNEKAMVDIKEKDPEHKRSERVFKKEETRKNSYKYSSHKDRDTDETRRTRRTNSDRIHQTSKKDDERSEDGGRKKYYESRKAHDSTQRDRYKDKDKSKLYGQKKSSGSATDINKSKYILEDIIKPINSISNNPEKAETKIKSDSTKSQNKETNKTICSAGDVETTAEDVKEPAFISGTNQETLEPNFKRITMRRKSLDCDKNRFSAVHSSNITNSEEEYSEKKRRNSVGSSKQNLECTAVSSYKYDQENAFEEVTSSIDTLKEKIPKNTEFSSKISYDYDSKKTFFPEENARIFLKEEEKPKRRNSTGDRQSFEKVSLRRNSLGSEDQNIICSLKEDKFDNDEPSKVDKTAENSKNYQRGCDPRTERRIRNKDRPSIAIYRPGMGKFSKQRLEREKGLGSSTEVESPSSSPSPTPVLKHKSLSLH